MSKGNKQFILASASKTRREMLSNAGMTFDVVPADLDEEGLIGQNAKLAPKDKAILLAEAKARHISKTYPRDLVIGSDQILEFEGGVLQKASNLEAALDKLRRLSGKSHHLISAVAVAKAGEILWSYHESATLHMRSLEEAELENYIELAGDGVYRSVGAYELEGPGLHLFESVKGDFFTILGLPLLSLLCYLRTNHDLTAF